MTAKWALVFASLSWLVACSSDSSSSTPAECSAASAKAGTVGGQCVEVMTAVCKRMVNDCKMAGTESDCLGAGVPACAGSHCDAAAISQQSAIDTCKTDLAATPCGDLTSSPVKLPSSCSGVVKRPASWDGVQREGPGAQVSDDVR
jgi:hypothetical protein